MVGQSHGKRPYPATIRLRDMPESYTVVDIETTGLDAARDSIIEISAIRIVDRTETGSFDTLVACDGPIPKAASDVNGITKDMLKGAPGCGEAISRFVEFAGGDVLLGHNVERFDRLFIDREVEKLGGAPLPNRWVDTLAMARRLYPGEHVRLADLCRKFGVVNETAHRALSDCRATSACYLCMRQEALSVMTEAAAFSPTGGKPVDSLLSGQSVVFTGESCSFSRHDLMQIAVDHGATVQDNVTLRTTLVVSADGAESQKVRKAREYAGRTGVEIVPLGEFLATVGIEAPAQETAKDRGRNRPGLVWLLLAVLSLVLAAITVACLSTAVTADGKARGFLWTLLFLFLGAVFVIKWRRK